MPEPDKARSEAEFPPHLTEFVEAHLTRVAETAWEGGWRAALIYASHFGTLPGKSWPETLRYHADNPRDLDGNTRAARAAHDGSRS